MSDMSEFPQKEYYVLAFFVVPHFLTVIQHYFMYHQPHPMPFYFCPLQSIRSALSYKEPEQLIKVKQFCEGKNCQLKVMAKTNLILIVLLITAPLS